MSGYVACAAHVSYFRDRKAELARRQRHAVFAHYGTTCATCDCRRSECLTIDHLAGDGNTHRAETGTASGSAFHGWLIRQSFPEGYRTLHFKCNFLKWRGDRRVMPVKLAIFGHYGDICSLCGFGHVRCLCLDRIDGGGGQHRRDLKVAGEYRFYRWLRRSGLPGGYRTLCYDCNDGRAVLEALTNPLTPHGPVSRPIVLVHQQVSEIDR